MSILCFVVNGRDETQLSLDSEPTLREERTLKGFKLLLAERVVKMDGKRVARKE